MKLQKEFEDSEKQLLKKFKKVSYEKNYLQRKYHSKNICFLK